MAHTEDLNGYKDFQVSKFDIFKEIKANYSDENYNKILSIKNTAIQNLASASSKSECDSIITSAINEALLINDLLDDEKENALFCHVKVTYPEVRGEAGVIEEHTRYPAGASVSILGEYAKARLLPANESLNLTLSGWLL